MWHRRPTKEWERQLCSRVSTRGSTRRGTLFILPLHLSDSSICPNICPLSSELPLLWYESGNFKLWLEEMYNQVIRTATTCLPPLVNLCGKEYKSKNNLDDVVWCQKTSLYVKWSSEYFLKRLNAYKKWVFKSRLQPISITVVAISWKRGSELSGLGLASSSVAASSDAVGGISYPYINIYKSKRQYGSDKNCSLIWHLCSCEGDISN